MEYNVGIGLIDELVLDQEDPDTGELLPNLGVYNDDEGKYKKFENENTIKAAMYIMKANININSMLTLRLRCGLVSSDSSLTRIGPR